MSPCAPFTPFVSPVAFPYVVLHTIVPMYLSKKDEKNIRYEKRILEKKVYNMRTSKFYVSLWVRFKLLVTINLCVFIVRFWYSKRGRETCTYPQYVLRLLECCFDLLKYKKKKIPEEETRV